MYPSLCIFHLHFTNFLHITIHKMYACIKLKATPFCTLFLHRKTTVLQLAWLSGKRKWRMYPEMFWFSGGSLSKTQWKPCTKIFHLIIFATKVLFLKLKFFSFWHHNYQRDISWKLCFDDFVKLQNVQSVKSSAQFLLKEYFCFEKKCFFSFVLSLSLSKVPQKFLLPIVHLTIIIQTNV